jgi:5-methylcytosine-specific restriction endonuclease McrA
MTAIPDGVGTGGRRKILDFLLQHVGEPVTTKSISEASGRQGQYGRRLRELRNEFGYDIASHRDDIKIPADSYILRSPQPGKYTFRRTISPKTRIEVLARNGYTCQACGVGAGDIHPDTGTRAVLQVGHDKDKNTGGEDSPWNLRALCQVCNQSASDMLPDPTDSIKLLTQVRKGSRKAQLDVLKALKQKFEGETASDDHTTS